MAHLIYVVILFQKIVSVRRAQSNQKKNELVVGSVSAEVLDTCRIPALTVPGSDAAAEGAT